MTTDINDKRTVILKIIREHVDKHGLPKSTRKVLIEFSKDVKAGRVPSRRTQELIDVWLKSVADNILV